MKYRKRILLSFASVLFLPLILNNVFIFTSIRNRELSMKREYITSQAGQIRGTVDYFINRILSDFVFLSYKDELRYLKDWYGSSDYRTKKQFLDDLNPFSMLSEYYDEAFLIHPEDDIMIDLKNKLISPISRSQIGTKIADIIDMHDQFGGKKELFMTREGDAVGFLIKSIPINERGTRMLLYIGLSDKLFKGVLDDIFLIDSSYAIITSDDGEIITFRSKDMRFNRKDPASYLPDPVSGDRSGIVENGSGRYLVAFEASTDLMWSYYYGVSFSSIEGAIWAVLFRYTLVTAGLLLLFSVVVQYISRGMYKPILDMAGLFHEGDAAASDIELKDIQENIRHLVERNRELSDSAGDTTRHEREAVLKSLVHESDRSEAEILSSITSLGLSIPVGDGTRYVVCAGIARQQEMQQQVYADAFYGNPDSLLLKQFTFPDGSHVEHFMSDERHFVLIVGLSGAGNGAPDGISVCFHDAEDFPLFIGVSGVHDRLEGIREGFREAMIALEYRSLFKGQSLIRYEDALVRKKSGYFYPQEIERKVISFIKQLDQDGVNQQFNILSDTITMAGISFPNTKRLYLHLLDSLVLVARDFSIAIESTGFGGPESLWDRIEQAESMRDIEAVVRSFALHLVSLLQTSRESPMVSLANAVKSFVDRNYPDRNLSLDLIADELKYSVSHVSTVFKETFGETVKDYITGLRLTRACELLVKTDMQISRIGNDVGYDNLGSFVKIFKAYLGETPKGYRLRIRGK